MSEQHEKEKRKIGMLVRITDSRGEAKVYRVLPLGPEQLTAGVARAFRLTRKAKKGERMPQSRQVTIANKTL